MRSKGKIVAAMYDMRRHSTLIQTEVLEDCREQVDALCGKDIAVELTEWSERRSLTANAYYWQLVGKTARALEISTSRLHNLYLRECSTPDLIGGEVMIVMLPDTDEAEDEALEREKFHIKPTSNVREGNKGVNYRAYKVLRGSHTFNKQEFSRLIDIAVDGAKSQGIETATPAELERIKEAYKNAT